MSFRFKILSVIILIIGLLVVLNIVSPAPNSVLARPATAPLQNISSITTGEAHTCALTGGGGIKCWGENYNGQLGDNTTTDRMTPVDVGGLTSGVSTVVAGHSHTCALTNGGGVKCWGANYSGQLGDNSTTDRITPADVAGLTSGVIAIAAGEFHTCAVTSGGGAKCWGYNYHGQLGDTTTTQRLTPVDVSGLSSGVSAIDAGSEHTCALTSGGGVKCWGLNNDGQLGNDSMTNRLSPVDVAGLTSGVVGIAAGEFHTCAVTSGGGAKCWGANYYGQLGDSTTTKRLTPVDVMGLSGGTSVIAASEFHSCAVTSGGGAKCWGANYHGQLGDDTTTNRSFPVDVTALISGVSTIAPGFYHTCAATVAGGVKCWGGNYSGQLGDGTTTQRLTPVDVVDGTVADFSMTLNSLQKNNTGLSSQYVVTNTNPSLASTAHNFHDNADNLVTTELDTIPANSSQTYDLASIAGLPDGYAGYVVVQSDQAITGAVLALPTYAISGRVTDNAGNGISSVIISNGSGHTTATDSNGNYSISGLSAGSYTLTASKSGYSFSPSSRAVSVPPDQSGRDFMGTPLPPSWIPTGFAAIGYETSYDISQEVDGRTVVSNLSAQDHTYSISIDLFKDGSPVRGYSTSGRFIAAWSITSISFNFGTLAEGDYQIKVIVQDEVGTSTTTTHNLTVRDYPDTTPTDKPLIIFVHGCCAGSGDSFQYLPQLFSNEGYPTYVIDKPYGYAEFRFANMPNDPVTLIDPVTGYNDRLLPTDEPIWYSSKNLSKMITDARRRANTYNKVILIAHSKGGLVSRVYLESSLYYNRDDVSRVIMLGTPNAGSIWPGSIGPLTLYPLSWWAELKEMEFEPMAEFNDLYNKRASEVDYHLIAGSIPAGTNPAIRYESDLVVPVFSVHGIYGEKVSYFTRRNTQHPTPSFEQYPDYVTPQMFYDCLKPLVENGQAPNCTDFPSSPPTLNAQLSSLQFDQPTQVSNFSGEITSDQTLSQTVQIDSTGPSAFDLFWDQGDLELTLTDPVGTQITPTSADSDSNIQFGKSITGGLWSASSYRFTTTTPGLWTMEVSPNDARSQPVSFVATVHINSDLSLSVDTDQSQYTPGQNVVVTAVLSDTAGGFPGAAITATVQRPDGITEIVTLYDDGAHSDGGANDGTYANSFDRTTVSGYYDVAAKAAGSRNSTSFERTAQAIFAVGSNNASLTGEYNDIPEDEDGDGLYESLTIMVGVDAATDGDYSVAVLLKDGSGEVIANQVVFETLTAGTRFIPVVFDGQIIRNHGVDGPYTVNAVRIFDNSGVALLADEASDVWTTAAYDYLDFEENTGNQPDSVYLPIVIKQ